MASLILGNIELGDVLKFNKEPLFVSLGPSCGLAVLTQKCGVRKAAFPFDVIYSMDGEKVIELLEDGFLNFVNEKFFDFYLDNHINTYYHLQFFHEEAWDLTVPSEKMAVFKEKYTRRINRFKSLDQYPGKVFFMRSVFLKKYDPFAVLGWVFPDNLEIDEEYSLRLYNSLKKCFPNLDFTLIMINNSDSEHIEIEKKLSDNLLIVRGLTWPYSNSWEKLGPIYWNFFTDLMNDRFEDCSNR